MQTDRQPLIPRKSLRLIDHFHTVFALIIVLPLAIGVYLAQEANLLGRLSVDRNVIFLFLIVAIIIAALAMIRALFERVANISQRLEGALNGEGFNVSVHSQTSEIRSIEETFSTLYKRYEGATRALEGLVQELSAANQLAEITHLGMGNRALMQTLLDKSMGVLQAEAGALLLYDKHDGSFRCLGNKRQKSNGLPETWMSYLHILAHEVMGCRSPIGVRDVTADPRWQARAGLGEAPRSCLATAICAGHDVIGMIALFDKAEQAHFLPEDEMVLSILVHEVGSALENSRLRRAIRLYRQRLEEKNKALLQAQEGCKRLAAEISSLKQPPQSSAPT